MSIYTTDFTHNFFKKFSKLDNSYKIKVKKLIYKIIENPDIGKPMRNVRKGTRELYAKPFRISYEINEKELIVVFLEIYHKDKQ